MVGRLRKGRIQTVVSGLVAGIVFGISSRALFKYIFPEPNVLETVLAIGIVISATIVSYRICYEEIARRKGKRRCHGGHRFIRFAVKGNR